MTQILNNGIVSMVPYCAQKLLGQCFFGGDFKGKSKVDSNELKVN